jgi:hypothetical protein
MRFPGRAVVLAWLLAAAAGASWGQVRGIYSCVDAKGRRLTSDRPIPECMDREQKVFNANGTVRETVGPSLTATERAEKEARARKAAEDQKRVDEEKRVQRALLARYPNQAAHDAERTKLLEGTRQDAEKRRIHVKMDEELARLKVLWGQPGAAGR